MSDYDDVGYFHEKFGLPNSTHHVPAPQLITPELRDFRLKFLQEELNELCDAYAQDDLAGIADALVDLVYVAMGTAHLHMLPWPELWDEVQRANMSKERCILDHKYEDDGGDDCAAPIIFVRDGEEQGRKRCGQPRSKHSLRGSMNDVIKPVDFRPPDITGVLREWGY